MERAKFLFDLNGFIVVPNVFTKQEIEIANMAIEKHKFAERTDTLRNSKHFTPFAGDMKHGRQDMAGMLGWLPEQRKVFRQVLTHPKLVPYYHMLVGEGYRLDHSPLVIAQNKGSEGFSLHGGPVTEKGFIPELQYVCRKDQIYNSLIAVSVQLTDHNKGEGGFCVVRGSHKMNFPLSHEMINGLDKEFLDTCVDQPVTKQGDVVIFSEATVHGCLPWEAERQRRIALYRFAPSTSAYARGYSQGWPTSFLEGMTEEEKAVMQPPYHIMYDRSYLQESGELGPANRGRAPHKVDFDKKVFNCPYY